ncbi:NAD(P)H:quinone oxidoreductase, type IV [Gongronella butleri]|nr:NAD(P)H:quinone oxidoreductase, type IV [Gongronella butleri]
MVATVYIVIYSLYHHVYKLAVEVQKGLEESGVNVKLFQVQETLSDEILTKMHAPAKPDIPIITAEQLAEPDGIIFGIPTRFGTAPAQIKALLDATGKLWAEGTLSGKFAGTFFSTASQHGGQETTALTTVTYFAHHGMIYVPFGFANSHLFDIDEVVGGSAYGAGTIANGDGSRDVSDREKEIAKQQGKTFGQIVKTYVAGKSASA